jgi:diketogulonate reductase-like aldo/keto reductase
LSKLRLDYVDLYLIHWPVAFKKMSENFWSQSEDEKTRYYAENVTLADTWKAMEKLVDLKLTHSIGVSNFNQSQIDEILKIARIIPAVNQIELHPYFNQHEMREYCAKHNIVITSYCPLSNLKRAKERDEDASALYNPVIQEIAKSKHKTTAQVIIRWHLQNGLVVIPKTVTPERLIENSHVFNFALSDNEMHQIDQLGVTNRRRFVNPLFSKPGDKKIFDN